MTEEPRRLGFIGTGLMGRPMIHRLLAAGYGVHIWNRTPNKLEPLVAAGAQAASSPAEAASNADVLFTCVSDAHAMEACLFSNGGIASASRPPPQLVDLSTIGPQITRSLAHRLHALCGTDWVDAPVSGGVSGAEQGRLVVFCGGTLANIQRLKSIFSVLAQRCTYAGNLGAGQALKLCNQLIVASNLTAIAEALTLARATGLDTKVLPGALAGGFADSLPLQIFGPRMAEGVTEPRLSQLKLMLKDLEAVAALSRSGQCRLPLSEATLAIFQEAAATGIGEKDLAALISLYSKT